MAGGTSGDGSLVARALAVLGCFDADHQRLALAEIARRADLPPSTAHRLVGELVRLDALRRGPDGRYEIGRRMWEIGLLAPVQQDLRELALPHLQDVHRTTGETVHLAVRDGLHSLYVERIVARTSTPVLSRTGARLPLHATAVGKVLLAHSQPDVVREALRGPRRVTTRTIVEPGRLSRELSEVRRRGFARTAEEMTAGAWSVAVPIVLSDGRVVAALGVVVGNGRRDLVRLVPTLQVAASATARSIPRGWRET